MKLMHRSKTVISLSILLLVTVIAVWWFMKPAKNGVEDLVHLRLQSFALSLHPLKIADVESRQVATLLYAGLIVQSQDGATLSAAADQWKRSGNIWEFTLKSGLSFSNGQPLQPEDVTTSLCNAMQPASPWAWALSSIQHEKSADGKAVACTGISAINGNTIRIAETEPVPWFLDAISGPAGWIIPAGPVKEEAYGVMPGLGPYTVKSVVPDVRVELEPRKDGSAIPPGTAGIQFDYIADDSVAAEAFSSGKLHVLDLTSPKLVEMLVEKESGKLKAPGSLVIKPWDRVRIAIINEKRLMAKGFSDIQVRSFIQAYSAAIDRRRIASITNGIGEAMESNFPPVSGQTGNPAPVSTEGFPRVKLAVITESDPYSDLIAAFLPEAIGPVQTSYRGVEKGVFIDSLIKGDFDIASLLIEATTHSPEFWKSFFTPGNPFTVFGKPLPGLENIHINNPDGLQRAAELIGREGNWVGILREKRLQAIAPNLTGILYSPSGQTNFISIGRQ